MTESRLELYRRLGKLFYENHRLQTVRFVFKEKADHIESEIERVSELIGYVHRKKADIREDDAH